MGGLNFVQQYANRNFLYNIYAKTLEDLFKLEICKMDESNDLGHYFHLCQQFCKIIDVNYSYIPNRSKNQVWAWNRHQSTWKIRHQLGAKQNNWI